MNRGKAWSGLLLCAFLALSTCGRALAQAVPVLTTSDPAQFPFLVGVGSVGGRMVFSIASNFGAPYNLWSSDGTVAGTQMIGTRVANLTTGPCNGLLFFLADEVPPAPYITRLWRTDGTPGGTMGLVDVRAGGAAPVEGELACANGRMLFNGPGGLWSSDGTVVGTSLMKSGVSALGWGTAEAGGLVFFFQQKFGWQELWRTDGTPEGTFKIRDLGFYESGRAARAGDRAFVRTCTVDTCALSIEDGTIGGSTFVATVPAPFNTPEQLYAIGRLFFVGCGAFPPNCDLWQSDGTPVGTYRLTKIGGDHFSAPKGFAEAFGRVYFSANDGVHGWELWSSDGTEAGTRMFVDVASGSISSNPSGLFFWRKRLFFAADDGPSGVELWATDGTPSGTGRFQDVNPGSGSSGPSATTAAGDVMMFWAAPSSGLGALFSLPEGAVPVAGSGMVPVLACRAVDTRRVGIPVSSGSIATFRLGGSCGVPATATAVVANITAVSPTGDGVLRIDSVTQATPVSSPLAFRANRTRAGNSMLRLVGSPDVAAVCEMPSDPFGSVHVVIDVSGYFE